jgi:hypothetical protein
MHPLADIHHPSGASCTIVTVGVVWPSTMRHPSSMPSTRRNGDMPDLFEGGSTPRSRLPSATPKIPLKQRHLVLPDDLLGSLKHLGDDQLDTLHQAITVELRRRGKLPTEKQRDPITKKKKPRAASTRSKPLKGEPVQIPQGQMNLIRASCKAGIKPGSIARQLGISLSVVRRVLAMQETKSS